MRARLEAVLSTFVGSLFHGVQGWLEGARRKFFPEPVQFTEDLPAVKMPWSWIVLYGAVGIMTWSWWPIARPVTQDIWVAVFSLEGLLATLSAAIVPFVMRVGVDRFRVFFWAGIDVALAQRQLERIQDEKHYDLLNANPASIRRALTVGVLSLLMVPLVLVIPERARAVVVAWSFIWTVNSVMPELMLFWAADWPPVWSRMYWAARSMHRSLDYCPICGGTPAEPEWPRPLEELNAAYMRFMQQRDAS